jgi:hypothetical protein
LAWDFFAGKTESTSLLNRQTELRCSTAKPTKREAVTAFKAKREKRRAAHRS